MGSSIFSQPYGSSAKQKSSNEALVYQTNGQQRSDPPTAQPTATGLVNGDGLALAASHMLACLAFIARIPVGDDPFRDTERPLVADYSTDTGGAAAPQSRETAVHILLSRRCH